MAPTLEREDLRTLQEMIIGEAEKKGWPPEKAASVNSLLEHLVSAAELARERSSGEGRIKISLKSFEPSDIDADSADEVLEEVVKVMEALGIPMSVERTGFFTPQEAAELLAVSKQTVLNWIKDGKISAERTAGGHFRIDVSAFNQFHDKREAFRNYRPKIDELAEMSDEELTERMLNRRKRRKAKWSERS